MFSDIVDYTAMMQDDEINTMMTRDKYREAIKKLTTNYDGRILQHYGDGTLTTFKSSVSAVQCAMQLQEEMQRDPNVPIRIGIHSGDVVFEDGGIFGDGVNVASRIESLGVPGSILVSEKLFDDIKNQPFIQVQSLGEFDLKNVIRPMEVFAITNKGIKIPSRSEMKGKLKERIKSIAVLPFVNMSNEFDNDYFSDGITEEIINALVKVDGLRVTSRTSSFAFKNKHEDLRIIGKQLGVNSILEGSVRKAGDRIRITAQLISISDGYHIWAENFDGTMDDIFRVQDEISLKIANSLREKLSMGEQQKKLVSPTENVEAYNTYLLGLFYQNKWTPANFEKAVDLYRQVIELEPEFSLPYEGLGFCYTMLGNTGHMDTDIAYKKAEEMAQKGLELNNESIDSYLTLVSLKFFHQWEFEEGYQLLLRALKINSNAPVAHVLLSLYHLIRKDFDQAKAAIERALISDPLSVHTMRTKADVFYMAREYQEAIHIYDQALKINPQFQAAVEFKGWAHLQLGAYDEAIAIFENQSETTFAMITDTQLGYAYALKGNLDQARIHLENLKSHKGVKKSLNYDFATLYTGLGEYEAAIKYLAKCVDEKNGQCIMMGLSPIWEPLHRHGEFKDLLARVGVE
ncbi:MAG: tetratricopeptide repeat protein [Reichenbachiella sp.]|uniref:tetratricopeptide repeat protein n=1 Tax=Reichenbachiella sp. TaxID=2184521 RepID=UPI003266B9CB